MHLRGWEPGPDLDPELADGVGHRLRAPDPPCGSVEAREEAVAGGVQLDPAEAHKLTAHQCVMALEKLAPRAVAQTGCALGRADDVLEEEGCQHAIRLALLCLSRLPAIK